MGRRGSHHVLATVVFTDIVDSSRLAHELGDRRWRVLLDRHHAIVRKALRRFHGREIDNAGDGFFASFTDQVDAIRSACAISDAVKELGIDVRAGCHVGQAEVVGRKLGGVTVHTGARVMSQAAPGEVLVSSMLKDLVPASGFDFADRGMHQLKGIDGEWHLYGVTSVDGTPRPAPLDPEEAVRLRSDINPPPLVERRWGRIGIAAIALLVFAGVAVALSHRPHEVVIEPNSVLRIDAATNEILADVPVVTPEGAQLAAVPPSSVDVPSLPDQVISVIDSKTNERVQTIGGFGGQAISEGGGAGIVFADGRIWVTGNDSSLSDYAPGASAPQHHFRIPGGAGLLAKGFGRIWIQMHDINRVYAFDPRSEHVVLKADIGNGGSPIGSSGIAVGEGSVWVSNYLDGTVSKIDPRSGRTQDTIDIGYVQTTGGTDVFVAGGPAGIAIGSSDVWVSDVFFGLVYRIDPATDEVSAPIKVGKLAPSQTYWSCITAAAGKIWVTSPLSKTIVRIDEATSKVDGRIHVPYTPSCLTSGYGSIWVGIAAA